MGAVFQIVSGQSSHLCPCSVWQKAAGDQLQLLSLGPDYFLPQPDKHQVMDSYKLH